MKWRCVVWLDRDGTIVDDPGYLDDPQQLHLLPGAAQAVARLNGAGAFVALVTNQSGIARGLMTQAIVDRIHAALQRQLARAGARLDAIYLCPHLPEAYGAAQACDCRKPRDGMVRQALREHPELNGLVAYAIGDKVADIGLARAVGARAILVRSGDGAIAEAELRARSERVDHCADDILSAVDWLLADLDGA